MSTLARLMNDFHSAILERDASLFTAQIHTNPRLSPKEQMDIYIEGYRLRLQEAIAADYPATCALLGQTTFDRLAFAFIEANPSAHFSLDHYPYPFADYIRQQANDPFAAALAALESAIAEVFLIEESQPLSPALLSNLTPEGFAGTVLVPRRASRLLQLDFPADQALTQQRNGATIQRAPAESACFYVVRHENEVKRHLLSEAEYLVLQQLALKVPVGQALETVAENYPALLPDIAANIQSWFSSWTSGGFFQSPTG